MRPVGEGNCIFRVALDGLVVIGNSSVEVALGFVGIAPIVVGESITGADLDGLVVVGNCTFEITLALVDIAPIIVGDGISRVELKGFVVVGKGAVYLALGRKGMTPAEVRLGILGVELDGLVEVRNGAAEVAFSFVGIAAVLVSKSHPFARSTAIDDLCTGGNSAFHGSSLAVLPIIGGRSRGQASQNQEHTQSGDKALHVRDPPLLAE